MPATLGIFQTEPWSFIFIIFICFKKQNRRHCLSEDRTGFIVTAWATGSRKVFVVLCTLLDAQGKTQTGQIYHAVSILFLSCERNPKSSLLEKQFLSCIFKWSSLIFHPGNKNSSYSGAKISFYVLMFCNIFTKFASTFNVSKLSHHSTAQLASCHPSCCAALMS